MDKPEASSEVAKASGSSTDTTEETTAVSAAEEDAEDHLFIKRATVQYTGTAAPNEQVEHVLLIDQKNAFSLWSHVLWLLINKVVD